MHVLVGLVVIFFCGFSISWALSDDCYFHVLSSNMHIDNYSKKGKDIGVFYTSLIEAQIGIRNLLLSHRFNQSHNTTTDIVVCLYGGIHDISNRSLLFTAEDSGLVNIIWRGSSDLKNRAIISGGVQLQDWKPVRIACQFLSIIEIISISKTIFKTTILNLQVNLNGVMAYAARVPNESSVVRQLWLVFLFH